jgi:hypothetical protein
MLAEPRSIKCVIAIRHIEADPAIPDKYLIEGEMMKADETAKDNAFFAKGRLIKGFTFNLPAQIKEGSTVKADVEFMGNPSSQNYHLQNPEACD